MGIALRAHPTRSSRLNLAIWSVLAVVCVLAVVGTAAGSTAHPAASAPRGSGTGFSTPAQVGVPAVTDSVMAVSSSVPAASTSAAVTSPRPAGSTGGVVVNGAGAVLPNPRRTPGAVNSGVTQTDIDSTICVAGWTATIRPPSSYTTALKRRQLASGYAYRGDTATADYEEDHLISLELGGSPDSELNLWPEPYDVPDGAHVKDVVENKLHALVCARSITLATAQQAIARNWWDAYVRYVGSPAAITTTHAAPPPSSSAPRPVPVPAPALSCTAGMSNASPAQYSTTDVIVHTASGATATASAHYKTTTTTNAGTAGGDGVADIPFRISRATVGYTVEVDVVVTRSGASSSCSTSFTPH